MLPYRQTLLLLLDDLQNFLLLLPRQPVTAVHGARKRTKQLRALLRFRQNGRETADRQLKSISRQLAPLRENHVEQETLQNLLTSANRSQTPLNAADLLQHLSTVQTLVPSPDSRLLQKAIPELQELFGQLPRQISSQQVSERLQSSFDLAVRQFAKTRQDAAPETLHTWRKRIKRLWYQQRFAEKAFPADISSLTAQSDDLGKILGDIHDLDNLLLHFPKIQFADLHNTVALKRSHLVSEAFRQGEHLLITRKTEFFKNFLLQGTLS